MVKARKYVLVKRFVGFPKKEDFRIVEEELEPLKDGEFLAEAVYISVDPYMRAYGTNLKLESTMIGGQVAKIIESKSSKFPVGRYVIAYFGWRTHTIASETFKSDLGSYDVRLLSDYEDLPLSYALGVLGMPGNSAYFGLLEICKPKAGETVVVTGAAGAVGSIVGQIAKIKGCRVIGVAGSDEKKKLLKELGFDEFINYKKPNFSESLKNYAPNGIDCYFDNVGGKISSIIINQMNNFGRISVCGSISSYNVTSAREDVLAPILQPAVVSKQLKMEGFAVYRWLDRNEEGIQQNLKWIREGKLKYKETVTEGFDNLFDAFLSMLQGGNLGKAVVKV